MRTKLLSFFFLFLSCSACSLSRAAGEGFSAFPLKIEGRIIDYMIVDVNGDARNDVVALSTSRGKTLLSLFLQDYSPFHYDADQQFPLTPDVVGVDVNALSGQSTKDLCLLTESGLKLIPFVRGRFVPEKARIVLSLNYHAPDESYRPIFLPMYFRIAASGKSMLIIPQENEFTIYQQDRAGKFSATASLNGSARLPLFAPLLREENKEQKNEDGIFLSDLNKDGKLDLSSLHSRGCTYYLQNEDGSFGSKPSAAITFIEDQSSQVLRMADCNGDALPDLFFLQESKTNFLSNKKTTISLFLGAKGEEQTVTYKSQPDHQWSFTGVHIFPDVVDYDSDGNVDLIVTKATYNLGNFVSALIGGKTKLQIEFYRCGKNEFHDSPDMIRETVLPGKIYDEVEMSPLVAFGDVTGDGRKDFILGEESAIFTYAGAANKSFESIGAGETPLRQALFDDVQFHRINSDAKEDMCVIERKQQHSMLVVYIAR